MKQIKPSNQETALLGLLAETPIHAGAGHSFGAIDLPIQREAHSDWPCIFGSAVKGALRTRAHDRQMDADDQAVIFGPDPKDNKASEHAGALTVSDARLILLPIRSLTGHFKWATCPALLRRLKKDLRRLGLESEALKVPEPPKDKALIQQEPAPKEGASKTKSQNRETSLFLEEFRLDVERRDLTQLIEALARVMPGEDAKKLLENQLVIVEDDLFSHLARYAVPVAAHVRIDNDTKTVADGALWYEESLPPETLFYVGLTAWRARKKGAQQNATEVLKTCLDSLFGEHAYLQVGGNETVGMGWCRVEKIAHQEAMDSAAGVQP